MFLESTRQILQKSIDELPESSVYFHVLGFCEETIEQTKELSHFICVYAAMTACVKTVKFHVCSDLYHVLCEGVS